MIYNDKSIIEASKQSLEKVMKTGGDGGVIGLDKNGNVSMEFNNAGRYRAFIGNDGELTVKIYSN